MTAAMMTKDTMELMKSPMKNLLAPMVSTQAEKSGRPPAMPMIGVMMSFTNAVTTAPNATPITTATARSTTLPRNRKF